MTKASKEQLQQALSLHPEIKTSILIRDLNDAGITDSFYTYEKESLESYYDETSFSSALIKDIIKNKKYIPKKGDKIYICPGSMIPRFKLKEFSKKYEVKIIKNPEDSNIKIFGNKTLANLFIRRPHGYVGSKEILLEIVKKDPNLISPGCLKQIQDITSESLVIDYSGYRAINYNDFVEDHPDESQINHFVIRDSENLLEFLKLTDDPSSYYDEDIASLLNEGIVLNEARYLSIKRLFQSDDKENIKLALDMMANCDYKSSAVYLLTLFKEHLSVIKYAKNKNHVNFKTLCKFFNITSFYHFDLDDIIESLAYTKLLTPQTCDKVHVLATQKFKDEDNTSEYFRISKVKPTKKLLNLINDNQDCDTDVEIIDDKEDLQPQID